MSLTRLLLDPAPGAMTGGAAAPAPAAEVPAPAPAPALDSTRGLSPAELGERPDPSGGDAGAGGGTGAAAPAPADPNLAAAVAPAGASAQTSTSIRDAARAYGLDLGEFQDDSAAWNYLVNAALRGTERNYYSDLGQQLAPHYQQIQEYLRRQEAPAPAARPAWQHPEFDERWLALCEKDAQTGTYRAKPGMNPQFADKVQQYAESVESWTTALARDPEAALAPLIEQVATRLIEGRFGQHRQQAEAEQILHSNESWLYQDDGQGRRLVGQDGKWIASPLGARYYSHLQSLRGAGVTDSRALDSLAKQLLQADVLASQAGARPAAPAPAAAVAARPNINPGQAVEPQRQGQIAGSTPAATEGRSLAEVLRDALREGGVTDFDFQSVA